MKKAIVIIFLIICNYSFAQSGKIYPKNAEFKVGELNTYVYEPPLGVVIPENVSAQIVYAPSVFKVVPIIKQDNLYEFSIKVPDSMQVLIMTIVDKKRVTIDNNLEKGYVVYLKNKTEDELAKSKLSKIKLSSFANYILKLNITPDEMIAQIDELYTQNPKLKEDKSYSIYLILHYQKEKDKYKPEFIKYAEDQIKSGKESNMLDAYYAYRTLNMIDKSDETSTLAISKFPNGEFAKNIFFGEFYKTQPKTEQYIQNELKAYMAKFNDNSQSGALPFYYELLKVYLNAKDTLNIKKYGALFSDKMAIANLYNNKAWELSGQDMVTPGSDLDFAKSISRQSIDITKNLMNHPKETDDLSQLQNSYIGFTDTYALIMYKLQKYDEAFRYQNSILELDENGMNPDGQERYAVYAEKAKGPEFAKAYIEKQLNSGVDSKLMMSQLEGIYQKLKLPMVDFYKIKENTSKLIAQKTKNEIIKEYGTAKAFDFTLTNLDGKQVKLSDYKGKVVVLDFWATWCGPCRASFPAMQELVTNYKNKDVEFFFVDVWERNNADKIKENVTKFIKDNNYNFNVLYDLNNDVASKYKVMAIPRKIVIDKSGEIVSAESSIDNLKILIDENIK